MTLEEEVVHVYIQALPVIFSELLLGILQQECCLANTACALDAYQAVVPVNLVHKGTTNWCVCMLYEIRMGPVECFHRVYSWFFMVIQCKDTTYFEICKVKFAKTLLF